MTTLTAAEAIRRAETILRKIREMQEFRERVLAAMEEASRRGCGLLIVGDPPAAEVELSDYAPPNTIVWVPKRPNTTP